MKCERCGADVKRAGIHGSTVGQASLFDLVTDPRATPGGRRDVRQGRAICGACLRQTALFEDAAPAPGAQGAQGGLFG